MAQRILTLLFCDMHDEDSETKGTETVAFAMEGRNYELDACQAHADALRAAMAPFTAMARRKSSGRPPSAPAQRRSSPAGPPAGAIREWAKANGYAVADRGRIAPYLVSKYNDAHAG